MTSSSPEVTPAYSDPSYWDQRYRKDNAVFDWYQKYPSLAPLFDLYLHRHHRLLLVGCGNSALGENMVDDGYQDIVSIDISSVVIKAMQTKYFDKLGLKYIKMDVRDMSPFESGSFDAVIDKGTLDSLMCGHSAIANATMMLKEVFRVLKDKGAYILITYGDPNYRLNLLRSVKLWNINLHVIERLKKNSGQEIWELATPLPLDEDGTSVAAVLGSNPEVHYIYVCIKGEESLRANQTTGIGTSRSQSDT